MRKLMFSKLLSGVLVIAGFALFIFVGKHVFATPNATGGADNQTKDRASKRAVSLENGAVLVLEGEPEDAVYWDMGEPSAKIAAGANANAVLSLELIADGGSGNQRDDGVTTGTVSGQGTTIAVEVFATGVTTSLRGVNLKFEFDASLLSYVKAENSAFPLAIPDVSVGTNLAAMALVTLAPSGFLARAEFETVVDVTGREFAIGIESVTLAESSASQDELTTTSEISFNAMPSPDFDGDGTVGFSDFLAFASGFGTQQGDAGYEARFDLDGDGAVGFSDFLIFAGAFGSQVPPSGNGGGGGTTPPPSGSPDLVVESPVVSVGPLTTGQSFTVGATVRNQGNASSASTTLRYYRSTDTTISSNDVEVGTDGVNSLSAGGTSAESISLNAPSSAGTYYYGACVESVSGESNTGNNCSSGVGVTVSASGSPDLIVESPSVNDSTLTTGQSFTLGATVRNQGSASSSSTTLRYYRSSNATISTDDVEVGTDVVSSLSAGGTSAESISLNAPSGAGTYFYGACVDAVSGESDNVNNCSEAVSMTVTAVSGTTKLYWTDFNKRKVQSSNLDGSVVRDLVTAGLVGPFGIALDMFAGKMYWTDVGTDKIQRSNLDGSSVEDLVTTGLQDPFGIALDESGGKIYWTDLGTDRIQRSNLDGSGAEDLVTTGLQDPFGIALDESGGKIYWTDWGTRRIHRSNLDGSGVEALVAAGLSYPRGIALDVSGGKIYWTDWGTDKIQRANLDGSGVEDLVTTGLQDPSGIALDVSGGKMYWTDQGADKIQRSNLDGSGVEDLVTTGLDVPTSIALGFGLPVVAGTDLVIRTSVSDNTVPQSQSFTLWATVRNNGTEQAAATKLRYYRSDDATIEASDTEVGVSSVNSLASSATGDYSIDLTAPGSMGTYYYGACVESVSGESNTGNNCSSGVNVTVTGSPDLIVESPTVDDNTPATGQSFTFSATVRNQGTEQAAATTMRYYRSDDATIDASDTEVGTDDVSGLSAGDTSAESISLNAPSDVGTYYYGACVESVSGESNTGNNCSSGVNVTVGGGPDLIVESPTVNDNTPTTGQSFTFSATVRNQGTEQAAATTMRYYRSDDATIDVSDTEVGTDNVSGLSAGDTSAESISLNAPSDAGTYYYGACVESVSGESNTDNNCSLGVITVIQRGSGSPDLIVESPSVNDNTLTTGQSFTFSATVRNRGNASAAATTLRYYRSSNATITTGDTEVGTDGVSSLSAGGTSAESISLNAPSDAGTYYYGACVDNVSGESNTGNNCSSGVSVTVGGSGGGSGNTYGVGEPLPNYPSGFFLPRRISRASISRSGGRTVLSFQNGGQMELQDGTTYTCIAAQGCSIEGGRVTAGTIRVTGSSGGGSGSPDLIVESPTVDDNTLTTGQSFTLGATVRNQGTEQAAATTMRYYRSDDATIDASDTEVGTDDVSSLSAGGTSAESISLNAPSSTGTYYYGACVESVSGESNTGNNCSSGVSVTVGGSGSPDLIVESPSVNDNTPTTGQSITFSATVRNQGSASSASTTLRYYRSSNATITTGDTEVGTDGVSSLSAGGASAESISLNAPSSAGTYHYGACVESVSGESNTGNNCSSGVSVTVGGSGSPDLIVESPTVDDNTPIIGQPITLSATVRNRGNASSASTTLRYYRSSNATITTGDTEVGTDGVSTLSAGGASAESISLNAPSSAGTYYYGACVESVSGESNTGNNCSSGVSVTVGAAFSVSGATCSGTYLTGNSGAASVSMGGTVRANIYLEFITLSGYANGQLVGSDTITDLPAGNSERFTIAGIITTSGSSINCNVRWSGRIRYSRSAGVAAGDAEPSEHARAQGSLPVSSKLLKGE